MASADLINGLEPLKAQSKVHIKQKPCLVNEYVIETGDGIVLYTAKEDIGNIDVAFRYKKNRNFVINVLDNQNKEIFWAKRQLSMGPAVVEIMLGSGQLVSIVKQKITFFKPVLYIHDSKDQMVFKIKSQKVLSQFQTNFIVTAPDGAQVGLISKLWMGKEQEMFTKADNFTIDFPQDLDVRYKIALITACFLIVSILTYIYKANTSKQFQKYYDNKTTDTSKRT